MKFLLLLIVILPLLGCTKVDVFVECESVIGLGYTSNSTLWEDEEVCKELYNVLYNDFIKGD